MRTAIIVQARMGSSRLPGKVLLDLCGEPLLARVVNRCKRAASVDAVAVAIPDTPANRDIAHFCESRGIQYFRGSEDDLLDRYHAAAVALDARTIVRVTADCPLIDPEVIDKVIGRFFESSCDYAANCLEPRTFPRGLDVEALSFEVLKRIWGEDRNPSWREHVTPYIYRNPDKFRIASLANPVDYSWHRWTVDTPEDLELARRIYAYFGHDKFSWEDVLPLFQLFPEWLAINKHVGQKELS